jgi:GMP synthase-like glutamine amidotransferase
MDFQPERHPMNLRIAVLLTNDDTSAFAAHFPNDGQKVVQLLQPLRPNWTFEVLPVKDGVLPSDPQDFDGYVITGSPASVNDDRLPWVGPLLAFIRAVDVARQPLIGLCFGHQAVARALGGQVARNAAGDLAAFDPAENVHRDHILKTSTVPAGTSTSSSPTHSIR